VFKNVVAQFIGQMRLMNQATTEIWGETSLICLKTNAKSKLNSLSPPEPGGRHLYMRYGSHALAIPSNAEFSVPQLKMLLKEVQQITEKKISLEEWQEL